ncbi:MAG: peptidylprolyl isomerase, partial [Thermoanaerobaculia bacterium]|nr:peptidylprolyl isomerase [Thermoanaerobaculia bacterium]
ISPVFESRRGYHLVLLEAIRPAGMVPFDEAKESLRAELLKERTQKVMEKLQALTQELRSASSISVNRENL